MVFASNDMLDVMRSHRRVGLGQPAKLAPEPSTPAYQPAKLFVHEAFRGFINALRAFACRIEMKSMART